MIIYLGSRLLDDLGRIFVLAHSYGTLCGGVYGASAPKHKSIHPNPPCTAKSLPIAPLTLAHWWAKPIGCQVISELQSSVFRGVSLPNPSTKLRMGLVSVALVLPHLYLIYDTATGVTRLVFRRCPDVPPCTTSRGCSDSSIIGIKLLQHRKVVRGDHRKSRIMQYDIRTFFGQFLTKDSL